MGRNLNGARSLKTTFNPQIWLYVAYGYYFVLFFGRWRMIPSMFQNSMTFILEWLILAFWGYSKVFLDLSLLSLVLHLFNIERVMFRPLFLICQKLLFLFLGPLGQESFLSSTISSPRRWFACKVILKYRKLY